MQAKRLPNVVALTDHDRDVAYTWAELDWRVGKVATVLQDLFTLSHGDRVVLICENDPRVFELQFACMRVGVVLVPLNWRLALPELHTIVADASPSLVVHDETWVDVAAELADKANVPKLAWDHAKADADYEELLASAHYLPPQRHLLEERTHILYTSGTTGLPKGAISTHGTLLWQSINLSHLSRMDASAHMLNPLPLFHAGGLLTQAMPILQYGGQITTMRRFQPEAMLAKLRDSVVPVTHLSMIPMMYADIASQPGFGELDLSALRCAIVAGAVASPELLEQWAQRGASMQPQYGGTEMGPCALALDVARLDKAKLGSQGLPPVHTELRLVDPNTGNVTDPRLGGEIVLRGPSITPGYWGRPLDEARDEDGWFHTGDIAWQDEDGYYYFSGRAKEMYKSGGENVHPAEVELVLVNHPDIAELAVIGVPDEKWGEVGLAVVVPVEGHAPTLQSVQEFGVERLARYKLPAAMVLVEELTRNVTGKVSRSELRDLYVRGEL